MNTGVQRSSATPPAARTATTPAMGPSPGNVFGTGKNVPRIAMAHRIPYVATASVSNLRDLEAKVTHAMSLRRRALHPHPRAVPARLGLGAGGHDQGRAARGRERPLPAVRGAPRRGHVAHADPPAGAGDRIPEAAEALRAPVRQGARRRSASRASRRWPTPTSPSTACSKVDAVSEKPFAITLDVGSSLANKTGAWRTNRPGLRRSPAAVQPRLPRRREHPGLAVPRRIGRLRGRLARADRGQSAARGDGARLLPPVRDARATAARSTRRSASIRSSASSATRRSSAAGSSRRPTAESGKRVLVVGAGPSGLVGGLSPAPARPRRDRSSRRARSPAA